MTNEDQVCCGPITRKSGNEYRCQRCDKDVTDAFRSAGLAGEVIRWKVHRPFVLDAKDRDRWPHIVEAWSKSDNPASLLRPSPYRHEGRRPGQRWKRRPVLPHQ